MIRERKYNNIMNKNNVKQTKNNNKKNNNRIRNSMKAVQNLIAH